VAGKHPGARPRCGAGRVDGGRRNDPRARPWSAGRRRGRRLPPRGHEPRGRRAVSHQEDDGALRWQREPGGQGARVEPERPLSPPAAPRPLTLTFDRRVFLLALGAALPAAIVSLYFLWTGAFEPEVQWALTMVIVGVSLGCAIA